MNMMQDDAYHDAVVNSNDLVGLFKIWQKKRPSELLTYVDEHSECKFSIDHAKKGFISDGVISPDEWSNQGVKILFVLKEAYNDNVSKYNLCDNLRKDGPWGGVWNRCAEWCYGVTSANQVCPIPRYKTLSHGAANQYLKRMAVVNLKKSDGNSSSSMPEIEQYVEYDKEEIRREIEIINPQIVICGSVFYLLQRHIYGDSLLGGGEFAGKWNDNWYYWTTALTGRPTLVIDFYHPANHFPAVLNYYALMGVYHQAIHDQARIESVGRPQWLQRYVAEDSNG